VDQVIQNSKYIISELGYWIRSYVC